MNKKLLSFFALSLMTIAAFFLRFGSVDGFAASWQTFSNGSTWIPFSPYGNRVETPSKLKRYDATHVVLEDQSLFWKGQGAVAVPQLNEDGQLEQLIITYGGSGYGPMVIARIAGAGTDQIKLGEVMVSDGRIQSIDILKTGRWYDSPRMFFKGENLPYSGATEIKFRNGQPMERRQYLEGELHGKWSRWKYNGMPLFERDYTRGLKHGTHMQWYGEPIDPKDYKSSVEENPYPSLWTEVNELAKEEFQGKHPSQESNEWVINAFKNKGGSLGPKLLVHYNNNRLHGPCEGFDEHGETMFKDEYQSGRRVQHKSFDSGTKWSLPRNLSIWAEK